jgi:hypothetical protein
LEAIVLAFEPIDTQMIKIQLQMRKELLPVLETIEDNELGKIASKLDDMG